MRPVIHVVLIEDITWVVRYLLPSGSEQHEVLLFGT